jgi:RimJ/RimL family protein N-acetyltransferase
MPLALQALIDEIMVPYLNAHVIYCGYFDHNPASRRVAEKCGFTFENIFPAVVTINPAKVNGVQDRKLGVGVLRWEREVLDKGSESVV